MSGTGQRWTARPDAQPAGCVTSEQWADEALAAIMAAPRWVQRAAGPIVYALLAVAAAYRESRV